MSTRNAIEHKDKDRRGQRDAGDQQHAVIRVGPGVFELAKLQFELKNQFGMLPQLGLFVSGKAKFLQAPQCHFVLERPNFS